MHSFIIINLGENCKIWTALMPKFRQTQFTITILACNHQTIRNHQSWRSCSHQDGRAPT